MLAFMSALTGTSVLDAVDAPQVKFKTEQVVTTTLDECIEALERGTTLPVFGLNPNEKSAYFVVYNGFFFAFLFYPTRTSVCTKMIASVAS